MRRIGTSLSETLYGVEATRTFERAATAALPLHSLMALAGLSVAQLTRALAPHARCVWIACGPGNNGGDGLVSALHLHRQAQASGGVQRVVVTLSGDENLLPPDAGHALQQARATGVPLVSEPPGDFDFAIDALLGIGASRPPEGRLAEHLDALRLSQAPVLCVDLPSGLNADTGAHVFGPLNQPLSGQRHTLSLLTLKPGLFTADGRDQAGEVWFDDLGITPPAEAPAHALLGGIAHTPGQTPHRAHASHKGSRGEVLVLGGQDISVNGSGMTGAAILAARAALHSGAGRVYVGLLRAEGRADSPSWDSGCPELMFREVHGLMQGDLLKQASVVCGCGGGSAIAAVLPQVIASSRVLVLDADALNAIALDKLLQAQLRHRGECGGITVLTPHPLEAARLLGNTTPQVMADRLASARKLSQNFNAICVLKGSGSVICAPRQTPLINPTGNAALATAGTGDVLAGMVGSALATRDLTLAKALQLVAAAVHQHGLLADQWTAGILRPTAATQPLTLTASRLAGSARALD